MIKKFRCKETEKVFKRKFSRKLPRNIQRVALRKLNIIHAALVIKDLLIPPSNNLKELILFHRKIKRNTRNATFAPKPNFP